MRTVQFILQFFQGLTVPFAETDPDLHEFLQTPQVILRDRDVAQFHTSPSFHHVIMAHSTAGSSTRLWPGSNFGVLIAYRRSTSADTAEPQAGPPRRPCVLIIVRIIM